MVHVRHFLIRNKRKKFGLIFTAIVCYGLRAAETSLLAIPRPKVNDDSPYHSPEAEVIEEEIPAEQARFVKSIPFPFELVHDTWENGPEDENLLRADVQVSHTGSEEVKRKMIYTRNPLPYLLRKTIVRTDEFVFQEEQHIDMRKKYSKLWSINRSFEDTVSARRTFALREDPHKKGWTIMEQSLSVSISNSLGGAAVARQLEKIARGTFMSGCDKAIVDLEQSLALKLQSSKQSDSAASSALPAESRRKQVLRKMAEVVISRGLILAGAALRVWAHLKAPHHACPRALEPGTCHVPQQQCHVKQSAPTGVDAPNVQELPNLNADKGPALRNPLKRVMSVAAAAFVSV